jgi:hypothetical protein
MKICGPNLRILFSRFTLETFLKLGSRRLSPSVLTPSLSNGKMGMPMGFTPGIIYVNFALASNAEKGSKREVDVPFPERPAPIQPMNPTLPAGGRGRIVFSIEDSQSVANLTFGEYN